MNINNNNITKLNGFCSDFWLENWIKWIKRNFTDRSQSTLIPLYKSLVRPHLEYCCSVQNWNPHFRKNIELIEGVQRRATKLVKGVEHLQIMNRLEYLGLMCHHTRRIRSNLINTYKLLMIYTTLLKHLFFDFDQSGQTRPF